MTASSNAADPTAVAIPAQRSPARGLLARWRELPLLVRAATGGFVGLMLAMMYLYPVNYGFDEPQHFDMAYAYAQGHGPYAPGHRQLSAGVHVESFRLASGYPPKGALADVRHVARSHRKSIAGYGGDAQTTQVPNQMVQHPPLYYLLGGAILAIPGVSGLHADVQFTLLRFLSLLLLTPVPWLCYATARRLGAGTLAPAAALVPLLFPALARSGAAVTNDSLMTLAGCVVLYLVTKIVLGDTSRQTALWTGGWLVVGLLTKGFALILPLLAVLAYLVCWRRTATNVIRQTAIVCLASALGGLWWLHNLLAYGAVQPDGFGAGYLGRIYTRIHPGSQRGHITSFAKGFFQGLVGRFWGSIGLIESPDYNWSFTWPATIVLLGLIAVALVRGVGGRDGRIALLVPLLMGPLTIVLLVQGSWPTYHRYVLLAGVQGRYLYPAIATAAGVAMLALSRMVPCRVQRYVPLVLVACATFAQLWTLRTLVHAWWITAKPVSTPSAWKNALHAIADWAPWPVGVTAVLAAVVMALEARLAYAAVRATVPRRGMAGPVTPTSAGSMHRDTPPASRGGL